MEITYLNLSRKKYGGRLYEDEMIKVLKNEYTIREVNLLKFQKMLFLNIPWILFVWVKYKFFYTETLLITGILSAFRGVRAQKNIVIVHHIDYKDSPFFSSVLQRVNFGYLLKYPKKFDATIVVSEFWKKQLEAKGFTQVHVLYNAFDPTEFDIRDEEVLAFQKKYALENKPIIYLGNGQKKKGAVEAYEMLKNLEAYFVVTGNGNLNLPVTRLQLNYREYLCLLKASKVVVLMSQLVEGWNRIAHEALLCGTPVIGSGKGGMREVLESAGQPVCEDFDKLLQILKGIDKRVSTNDTQFLRSLDKDYFKSNTVNFFNEILNDDKD